MKLSPDDLKLAATRLDIYGTQRVPYSQFIAASLNAEGLVKDEMVGVVFKLLDIDRDGVVSSGDLTEFIKSDFKILHETKYGQELAADIAAFKSVALADFATLLKSK